jgi:hypothetical protein
MNALDKLAAKRHLASLIKESAPAKVEGAGIAYEGRSGPDRPVKTKIKTPGGEGSVTNIGVDKYRGAAKLVQARQKARFGPLLGAKPDDTPRNRALSAERAKQKATSRSRQGDQDLRMKLFGHKSLNEGWTPPTSGRGGRGLTGMQKSYIAKLQGKPAQAHLTADGSFINRKAPNMDRFKNDVTYAASLKGKAAPAVASKPKPQPKPTQTASAAPAAGGGRDWVNMGYKQRKALKGTMNRKEWQKGMSTWWKAHTSRRKAKRLARRNPTSPPAT